MSEKIILKSNKEFILEGQIMSISNCFNNQYYQYLVVYLALSDLTVCMLMINAQRILGIVKSHT